MSKQSNQRFRKELEKCQNQYNDSKKNVSDESSKNSYKDSYNNNTTNLVDKYND